MKILDIHKALGKLSRIGEGGKLIPMDYEEMKKFDIDLEFGKLGEDFVRDLQEGNTLIEVKTERDIWKTTGNIAIEIRYNGKPSGLSTTGSNVWVHLLSYKGVIEGGFIFNVDSLKKRIKELKDNNKLKLVMGGDFDASQMALLPIKDLFKISI